MASKYKKTFTRRYGFIHASGSLAADAISSGATTHADEKSMREGSMARSRQQDLSPGRDLAQLKAAYIIGLAFQYASFRLESSKLQDFVALWYPPDTPG